MKDLKTRILKANKAYRDGHPIIGDVEYDELLDEYSKTVSQDEFEIFLNSLNEGTSSKSSKITHKYVAGSLDKYKYDEPDEIGKFIKKYIKSSLHISAKIDGISGIAHYVNGNLVCLATRGDGYVGEDLTDKAKYIRNLPQKISSLYGDDIYVRGELVILKSDYKKIDGSSARNIVAGLMNRKEWNKDDISLVSFISYTVLGNQFTKAQQFNFLDSNGFKSAWNMSIVPDKDNKKLVETLYTLATKDFEYQTDGLVLCDSNYINENVYRPSGQVAFKINTQQAVTSVLDVSFSEVSKDGKITPIAILEPVELGGVTISKATLYNSDFITQMDIRYGSKVLLQRSGDVIPKILKVVSNDDHTLPVAFPAFCPCCGSKLVKESVDYYCKNKNCLAQVMEILEQFVKKLKIKNVSKASLMKWGITDFDKLLSWRPNQKYKSEVDFYNNLLDKCFTLPKEDLICCFNFKGLSDILLKKIFDYYGFEKALDCYYLNADITSSGFPDGIGELTMKAFSNSLPYVIPYYEKFIKDSRYNPNTKTTTVKQKTKGTIIFTGSLSSMSRSNAQKLAENNGWKIASSVSKGLDYLVTANKDSTSSKMKRAKELNVKIIGEEEFLKMMDGAIIDIESV